MAPTFMYPPKPQRGDAIAVLSPSWGGPAAFPMPFELGLARLRDEFGLRPVEYPTTRAAQASPAERAKDLHSAFGDPEIKAVLTSIGGEDEIKVLRHLDPEVLAANPKPFFGYSDNTNLHLFLWNLGLVSYQGGAVMVQFGRPGSMHPVTRQSIAQAMFTRGSYVLQQRTDYNDEEGDWADPAVFSAEPPGFEPEPWSWHGPKSIISGPAWGGCLEIVDFQLRVSRCLLPEARYEGSILFFETSEEMPPADYVYRVLMCMGERELLQRFAGIVWGRPKAWFLYGQRNDPAAKTRYTQEQRNAVLAAVAEYHPDVPVVFGVDFGHTEPQYVVPSGGTVTIDSANQRIEVSY